MITLKRSRELFVRHLHFVGPGLVSSVAYIDPGNWATDLQAGASYGYKLLFIVLVAGLAAVVLQLLSVRLGAVTSQSLPHQTRQLFLRLEAAHPKNKFPLRCCLYTLYGMAEIAIIATDLAELLGSAIALNLLFPKLPLFAGVLITAVDVLIVLLFFKSDSGRQGMLFFEIVIVSLVVAVFISFMILLHLIRPEWKEVFLGLVPSKTIVQPGALYVGVGIIGATVMPHALFLGSSLAGVDRLNLVPKAPTPSQPPKSYSLPSLLRRHKPTTSAPSISQQVELEMDHFAGISSSSRAGGLSRMETEVGGEEVKERDLAVEGVCPGGSGDKSFDLEVKQYEHDVRAFDRISWVDTHILHSTIDTTISLLGFALTINASILTVAGAAYFYNPGYEDSDASLGGAHALLREYIGRAAALIFALALLCAAQSASITATLAGQVVSEGFIDWKTSPLIRRMVTRLIGVIPAATVAAAVGNKGLNTMLVASQVILSVILPTVIFPLVYLCSRKEIMVVDGPEIVTPTATTGVVEGGGVGDRRRKVYASPLWVTILGYTLFTVVIAANVYVIVELIIGS